MADEPKISQRYRAIPREEPPRHLDDAILAASRRAVAGKKRHWYVPLAAAAVIVLAVAVTVHVDRERPSEEVTLSQAEQKAFVPDPKPAKGKKAPTANELIERAKQIGADGLDLSATETLDAAFAKKVKSAGLKLYVWTVNDIALARRMVAIGVDGITTDRPGWLREQLGQP